MMSRSFGYEVESNTLHALVMQVDADFSGALDFHETLKVVRMVREREMRHYRKLFLGTSFSKTKKMRQNYYQLRMKCLQEFNLKLVLILYIYYFLFLFGSNLLIFLNKFLV